MATDLIATAPATRPSGDAARYRRRRRVLWATAAVAAIAATLATASVFGRDATRAGDSLRIEGAAASFDLPRVGAPDERVALGQFAGQALVVNFWASWCVPCRNEMPALEAVATRLAGRVAFVGINHQDGRTPAAEFQQDVGVSYPSGYDPDGGVARAYGVLGLPTTVLVDARGRIVGRRLGELTEAELADLLESAFGSRAVGAAR